ncbi:hypothetical protein FNF28_03367 [Cafeteria roenbergensis]|uniref:Response regulatory domain-containing protein n=1 Tax=Cafeteria roenbergensis TaxID=33653 RepID=A0A5A8DKH2_CAFRO|nr:hypothetical protein FNF28_03367 [Cafeteria roenbergensis]
MVLVCLVVALSLSTPMAAAPSLRSRIVAFLVVVCMQCLLWPPATGARFAWVPVPFWPGSCLHVLRSSIVMFLTSSVTTAHIGTEWPEEDDRVVRRCGRGGWFQLTRGAAASLLMMTAEVWLTGAFALGLLGHIAAALVVVGSGGFLHMLSIPLLQGTIDIAFPAGEHSPAGLGAMRAWLLTSLRRRVTLRTSIDLVGFFVLLIRALSGSFNGFVFVTFGMWQVCSGWERLASQASPPGPFPDGLDAGASDGQDLLWALSTTDAALLVGALGLMLGPAVSMTLQLQLGLTAARTAQRAKADRQLLHAVTYVSHHTRGPLNAAVMCLTVLEESCQQWSSQAGLGVASPRAAMLSASPRASDVYWAQHSLLTGRSQRLSLLSDATPTSASMLRDLGTSLESAKQQLDDLLLWQRLGTRKAATHVSWAGFTRRWRSRLEQHFEGQRTEAGVELRVHGLRQDSTSASASAFGPGLGRTDLRPASATAEGARGRTAEHASARAGWLSPGDRRLAPAAGWLVLTDHARVFHAAVAMLALGSFAAAAGARREARKLLPHDPKGSAAVSSSGLVSASASAEPSASPSVQVAVSVVAAVGDLGRPPTFEAVPPPAGAGPAVAGELVVEVRYDGDGFDAAQLLERDPFEPFDRSGAASSTTATAEDLLSGDGLRLAVLRGVATSLHGEAGVASGGRRRGAHLWLRAPVWMVPAPATAGVPLGLAVKSVSPPVSASRIFPSIPEASGASQQQQPLAGRTVWLADDDATVLRVERRLLERWGARVEGFADGADVVARLRELQTTGGRFPDTLVIDSQMPRLDGLATVRALQAMGRGVAWGQAVDATGRRVGGDERWSASGPLLVLATGESSRPLEAEARGLGVREVLVKPLRADRLLEELCLDLE